MRLPILSQMTDCLPPGTTSVHPNGRDVLCVDPTNPKQFLVYELRLDGSYALRYRQDVVGKLVSMQNNPCWWERENGAVQIAYCCTYPPGGETWITELRAVVYPPFSAKGEETGELQLGWSAFPRGRQLTAMGTTPEAVWTGDSAGQVREWRLSALHRRSIWQVHGRVDRLAPESGGGYIAVLHGTGLASGSHSSPMVLDSPYQYLVSILNPKRGEADEKQFPGVCWNMWWNERCLTIFSSNGLHDRHGRIVHPACTVAAGCPDSSLVATYTELNQSVQILCIRGVGRAQPIAYCPLPPGVVPGALWWAQEGAYLLAGAPDGPVVFAPPAWQPIALAAYLGALPAAPPAAP
mgnify:CR=1 FL=1